MDDQKLIELVRNHPAIYNKTHKDYKNPVKKGDAWNAIAQELGELDSTKCYKRWTTLRERYAVEVRKRKKKDPDGAPTVFRPWIYYPLINSFLGKYYMPRKNYIVEPKKENPVQYEMEDTEDMEEMAEMEEMTEMEQMAEMEEIAGMEDMPATWNESEDLLAGPKTAVSPQASAVSAMLSSLPQPYLGAAVEKVMPIILQYARMSRLRLPVIE